MERDLVNSIVGKGNHSVNHVQKIKPRVEQICQELGLQYATEENAGRIYVNLQGGPAVMPPYHGPATGGYESHHPQQHGYPQQQQQPQYGQSHGYPGNQQQQQQQQEQEEVDALIGCLKGCCSIM